MSAIDYRTWTPGSSGWVLRSERTYERADGSASVHVAYWHGPRTSWPTYSSLGPGVAVFRTSNECRDAGRRSGLRNVRAQRVADAEREAAPRWVAWWAELMERVGEPERTRKGNARLADLLEAADGTPWHPGRVAEYRDKWERGRAILADA